MNIQKLFQAIKDDPLQHTFLVAVTELERQGYSVIVDRKFRGSTELWRLIDENELEQELSSSIGVAIEIKRGDEQQIFRLHLLDVDAVALTVLESPPVVYDTRFTLGEFRTDASS